MPTDSDITRAIKALEAFYRAAGEGRCFPSDEIWNFIEGPPPESGAKPHLIRVLDAEGYIVKTGRTTKASSGPRKGSPTTEYTFGPKVSPESLEIARSHRQEDHSFAGSYTESAPSASGQRELNKPLQRLLHGCPGSGKSYRVDLDAQNAHRAIRTVFHPETRYSDFVGGLRPASIYRVSEGEPLSFVGSEAQIPGEPYVHYVVQPGPLLKAYHIACLHPEWSVVLVIEELSRAVAAHVFGDTLQLLDRLERGKGGVPAGFSEYEIDPRPDIRGWLLANEIGHPHVEPGHMRFPANLYIWATMNRSDQNARQLDSAFLRRWTKEYLSYRDVGAFDDVSVLYGGVQISWKNLRSAINERLKGLEGVPEDKFVGPYFLSPSQLDNPNAVAEDLWGYLWNDVLKTRAPQFFDGAATFAELLDMWQLGAGSPIGKLSG